MLNCFAIRVVKSDSNRESIDIFLLYYSGYCFRKKNIFASDEHVCKRTNSKTFRAIYIDSSATYISENEEKISHAALRAAVFSHAQDGNFATNAHRNVSLSTAVITCNRATPDFSFFEQECMQILGQSVLEGKHRNSCHFADANWAFSAASLEKIRRGVFLMEITAQSGEISFISRLWIIADEFWYVETITREWIVNAVFSNYSSFQHWVHILYIS